MKRLHPLNWIQWLTLALAAMTAASFIVLYNRITNVQAHQNDALHAIICRAEHFVRTQPGITAEKRQQALRFYDQSLSDANLKPCD